MQWSKHCTIVFILSHCAMEGGQSQQSEVGFLLYNLLLLQLKKKGWVRLQAHSMKIFLQLILQTLGTDKKSNLTAIM